MFARKSLLIFLNNGVAAVLGLVGLFFVGRYMDPATLGLFAFGLGVAQLVGSLSRVGLDKAHMKRISEGQDLGDCIATYAAVRGVVMLAAAGLLATGALWWDRSQGFVDSTTLGVLLVMVAYMVLDEARRWTMATFDALKQSAKSQWTLFCENVVRVPAMVAAAVLFGASLGRAVPLRETAADVLRWFGRTAPLTREEGALLLAVAYVLGVAASFAAGAWVLMRHRYPWGRYDGRLARQYLRFALPLAMVSLVGSLSLQLDKLAIGFFWGASDVGHYFAAQRLVTFVLVLPAAVGTLFFPLISELGAMGQTEGVRAVAASTRRLLSLAMTLLVAGLVAFAPSVFPIFLGSGFAPAEPILVVLALNALFVTHLTVAMNVFLGFSEMRLVAGVGLWSAGGNLVLNALLVPTSVAGVPLAGLAGVGAAVATAASTGGALMYALGRMRRLIGPSESRLTVPKHLLAGVGATAFGRWSYEVPLFGGVDRYYELAAAAAATAAVYVALLHLLREWGRRDWRLLGDLFDPRKMAGYVREELTERKAR